MSAPVVIVGAGFAGLATACALTRAGRPCVVLDRRARLGDEGAALVVQPNGLQALDSLGLIERVQAEALPITDAVQRGTDGRDLAAWDYSELGRPHSFIVAIERARMLRILLDGLGPEARLETGCEVLGLLRDGDGRVRGVSYRDADGAAQELAASWVVGADGAGSRVREAMGARLVLRTGPYRYLLGISPWHPPKRAALMYHGRGWANGVISMREGADFWDGITEENREAVERRDFDAWREVYRRRVPEADALLEGFSSLDQLPTLSGRTHRAVPRVMPGVVLAGDAAAAVHPHSGQGGNLALVDAVALGQALIAGRDEDVEAYATVRDRRMRLTVPFSLLTGYTYDGPNLAWRAVRAAGYGWSRVPPVRRALLMRGAGLA